MKTNRLQLLTGVFALAILAATPAPAATAAENLEQGVQLQETEGDLDAAIRHFEAVLRAEEKIDKLAAEARFRLAQCHLAKKQPKSAREQIDALRKDWPVDNRWVKKAAVLMPVKTNFHGVPWTDGKAYRYSVRMADGKEIGQFVAATRKVEIDGKPAWEAVLVRAAGSYSLSRVRFLEDGYRPVDSRWYFRGMADGVVEFGTDGIARLIDAETGKQHDTFDSKTLDASKLPVYDNDQLVQLMRALSLEIGTKQKTTLISVINGAVPVDFNMEVTAHEEVEVPAGTFQCAKIETNLKQTFYIGLEDDHPLVKIGIGPASVVLASEFDWDPETPGEIRSERFGFRMKVPGPVIGMQAIDNDEVYRQQFWSADFAGRDALLEINWTRNLVEEAKGSSRECAEHMIKLAGKNLKEWGPVEGSWEKIEVGGVEGVAVRTKGVQGDITVQEFQVYALGKEKTVILRMNYGPLEEKEARARALELVKSLKWDE